MRCAGKVAIVTGASRGIGRAIAVALAREGADIVAVARTAEAVKKVAAEITALGRKVLPLGADVSKTADAQAVVRSAIERFGTIDILVDNAGIHLCAPFVEESEQMWTELFRVNVLGCTFITQAVVPHMIAKHYGRIVNMTSKAAVVGEQNHVAYSSVKGAVLSMIRALAVDMASHGITVNGVAPGPIMTEMLTAAVPEKSVQDKIAADTPLGRLGKPEDIAAAVVYLASDEADWIAGQILSVDGGLSILK